MPSTQPGQSDQTSQTKKATSRAKKSTQSKSNKETPKEKQPTVSGESTTATKSSKAIVDEFLAPSFRLPVDITLPENYTVDQLFNKFDAVELRAMADKHSRGDSTKKGVLSNTKKTNSTRLPSFHREASRNLVHTSWNITRCCSNRSWKMDIYPSFKGVRLLQGIPASEGYLPEKRRSSK